MQDAKISPGLSRQLEASTDDELVDLVVELEAQPAAATPARGVSRRERLAAVKKAFEEEVRPLQSEIEQAGGEVTDRAWINQTLRARLPKRAIAAVTARRDVRRLDSSHRIEAD